MNNQTTPLTNMTNEQIANEHERMAFVTTIINLILIAYAYMAYKYGPQWIATAATLITLKNTYDIHNELKQSRTYRNGTHT